MKNHFKNIAKIGLASILALSFFTACANTNTTKPITESPKPITESPKASTDTNVKKITMGTNAAFPPFEYMTSEGIVEGFDIDISKKIAEKLGVELVISDVTFNSLFINLESEKIDFIAAGCTINEERKKNADFSETYFDAKQVVIVLDTNNDIKTIDDLIGKKIGVQSSTTGQSVAEGIENTKVTGYDAITQAAIDMKNGKLDALIIDQEPGKKVVEANETADLKLKLLDVGFEEEQYAIAVKKGNTELLTAVNEVLKELKDSGEYDVLVKKYFK